LRLPDTAETPAVRPVRSEPLLDRVSELDQLVYRRGHLLPDKVFQELVNALVRLRAEIERRTAAGVLPAQMENASARRADVVVLVNDLAAHIKPHGLPTLESLRAALVVLGRAIPTRHEDNLQAVETER
jgi:hypothetical protein